MDTAFREVIFTGFQTAKNPHGAMLSVKVFFRERVYKGVKERSLFIIHAASENMVGSKMSVKGEAARC